MCIDELIEQLQEIRKVHGNLNVIYGTWTTDFDCNVDTNPQGETVVNLW